MLDILEITGLSAPCISDEKAGENASGVSGNVCTISSGLFATTDTDASSSIFSSDPCIAVYFLVLGDEVKDNASGVLPDCFRPFIPVNVVEIGVTTCPSGINMSNKSGEPTM